MSVNRDSVNSSSNLNENIKSTKESNLRRAVVPIVLLLMTTLVSCSSVNEFENLQMKTDYSSIQMMTETFDAKNTVTKMLVTLRNTGKKPIYVDGKFIFSIVKVGNQGKNSKKFETDFDAITTTPAQKMDWLSIDAWSSVNEVFQALEPYEEKEFVVAVKLPNNTYIESLKLVSRANSDNESLGITRLGFCPFKEGATASDWSLGKFCKSGKLI